jgi:hypothetical protein
VLLNWLQEGDMLDEPNTRVVWGPCYQMNLNLVWKCEIHNTLPIMGALGALPFLTFTMMSILALDRDASLLGPNILTLVSSTNKEGQTPVQGERYALYATARLGPNSGILQQIRFPTMEYRRMEAFEVNFQIYFVMKWGHKLFDWMRTVAILRKATDLCYNRAGERGEERLSRTSLMGSMILRTSLMFGLAE